MRSSHVLASIAVLPLLVVALPEASPAATTTHSLVYLELPRGLTHGIAQGVNNNGEIVGWANPADFVLTRPLIWNKRGKVRQLRLPKGTDYALANAINDSGVVVGYAARTNTQETHAVVWRGNTVSWLPVPVGAYASTATSINARGDIAGSVSDGINGTQVAVWPNGSTLQLGPAGSAVGIGADGTVAANSDGLLGAFTWHAGEAPQPLAGVSTGDTTTAFGMNESDIVAGASAASPGASSVAATWTNRAPTQLPTPTDASSAWATAVNDTGTVAGRAFVFGMSVTVLWSQGGVEQLPSSDWTRPLDLNDAGVVVGTYEFMRSTLPVAWVPTG